MDALPWAGKVLEHQKTCEVFKDLDMITSLSQGMSEEKARLLQ
jgi:hypothetical protein